jgi:anti-anti-sigma factor
MRSEALDITIESRQNSVWLLLSGPFHNEQVPNIREKITGLIDDGNKDIVVDLENITEVNDAVVPMFLRMLNLMKGKHGELKLVFRNPIVTNAFAGYRNIFAIYPDSQSLAYNGFLNTIRRRGMLMSRKTGVRLSRPVAIFLLVVLVGWFCTLAFIIHIQNQQIHAQERELHELTEWKQKTTLELEGLKQRLQPFEQLGLLRDSLPQ